MPRFIAGLLFAVAAQAGAADAPAPQPQRVVLATLVWEPYIGESLPGKGYVYQLVTAAFARVGMQVDIRFYPWARALAMARAGQVDGLLPEYYDEHRLADFVYSKPFPGGPVGFCALRDRHIKVPATLAEKPEEALKQMRDLRFGVVRGYLNSPAFDSATYLKKDEARDDASNLRKLIFGRVDVAVVDRYVAHFLLRHELKKDQDRVECLDPPLQQQSLYIAFSRHAADYPARVEAFNRGLAQVTSAPELAEIMRRTGLAPEEMKKPAKSQAAPAK